jgi:hypothetical protein
MQQSQGVVFHSVFLSKFAWPSAGPPIWVAAVPDGERHVEHTHGTDRLRAAARVLLTGAAIMTSLILVEPANAQDQKPNILVIMGDDIGMWNIGAYHRGLMAGTTPNLDKIAKEGMLFTDYYAEASCTAGAPTSSPGSYLFVRD